jgi:hypothetical protein
VENVLLINAALRLLFLSDTYPGSTHDKRVAAATPYPLPAGSRLLQDLGFLAFTSGRVELIMPTKKPRGRGKGPGQPSVGCQLRQDLGQPSTAAVAAYE